jgi:hypothetical protein
LFATDNNNLLAHVASDWQAEAATNHIAQKIEQYVVETPIVEAELLEGFEAVDDAATTAAATDLGATKLHRVNAVALEANIANLERLTRQFFL